MYYGENDNSCIALHKRVLNRFKEENPYNCTIRELRFIQVIDYINGYIGKCDQKSILVLFGIRNRNKLSWRLREMRKNGFINLHRGKLLGQGNGSLSSGYTLTNTSKDLIRYFFSLYPIVQREYNKQLKEFDWDAPSS